MLFLCIFWLCIEGRLFACNEHLVCMFWKSEEAEGWLEPPEGLWCQEGTCSHFGCRENLRIPAGSYGLVTEVWVIHQEWCSHECRKMLQEICWAPCELLDGEVVTWCTWCPVVSLSHFCLNRLFFLPQCFPLLMLSLPYLSFAFLWKCWCFH